MSVRLTIEQLADGARHRPWIWLSTNLHDTDITPHDIGWAITEAQYSDNVDLRIVGASYLTVSTLHLNILDVGAIIAWLEDEINDVVRYRLAIALYKRGNRDDLVVDTFDEACASAEMGAVAAKYKDAA